MVASSAVAASRTRRSASTASTTATSAWPTAATSSPSSRPTRRCASATASSSRRSNSVLRCSSTATGAALTGVQDLNTFFDYPAAINRATGDDRAARDRPGVPVRPGPPAVRRRHHHPGSLRRRRLHRQEHDRPRRLQHRRPDRGVDDLPGPGAERRHRRHARTTAARSTASSPGPCFQDYPHIGADANGVYVSTNEYDLFGPNFNAAQIFAFSKAQLAAHPASSDVTLVENLARRRLAGLHRLAGHLAGRASTRPSGTAPSTSSARSPATAARPATRPARLGASASGR